MAKGDNNKAANAAKDAVGAADAALKNDASTVVADVKSDVKQVETETADVAGQLDGAVNEADSSVVAEAEDFVRDLSRGFGLLSKVRDAVRAAGAAAKADADKALSELHDAVATLCSKIEAAGEHVDGDLGDFLAELKAHL